MELSENLKNSLVRLRKEKGITQEVLATVLDISVQAVSKWETGVSLPDIMQLPRIADFFQVTIDSLFYNDRRETYPINGDIPNDNKMRIIQFYGNKMLDKSMWEAGKGINLKIPEEAYCNLPLGGLNVEIWGNAEITGDIRGYVECEGFVNCGNVGSYVESESFVNCNDIGSYLESEGYVNCGNIGGHVECGGSLNCGNVEGYVECEGNLSCGNINGYAESEGALSCGDIGDYAEAGGDLKCSIIKGSVECEGDIYCQKIFGNVECDGNIIYEREEETV